MEHDVLTIASRTEQNDEREENGYVIRERRSGPFRRSFSLPKNVEADRIRAAFRNGLLILTVPKSNATQKSREIPVKSGP